MRYANIIKITNTTPHGVVMYPKDKEARKHCAIFCGSNSYKIMDLIPCGKSLNLDEFYFQFQNDKKKISIKNIHKYGVKLEYELYESKLSPHDNVSTIRPSTHTAQNDVYTH